MNKIKIVVTSLAFAVVGLVSNAICSGSLYDYPVKLWRSSVTAEGLTPTLFASSGPIVIHNIIQVSTRATNPGCGELWVLGTERPNFDTNATTIAHRSFVNATTVETPFNVISSSRTYIQRGANCVTEIWLLWEWLTNLSMSHTPF